MRFTVNEKREIGGCEISPLSLKYGPYLALPDGPEPPVLRLAPETERSGPLPANPSTAYQGGGTGHRPNAQYSSMSQSAVLLCCLPPWGGRTSAETDLGLGTQH